MTTLVGLSGCGACSRARAHLNARGVPYTYRERTTEAQVPVLVTDDGQRVVGFDPALYDNVLGVSTTYGSSPWGLGDASTTPPASTGKIIAWLAILGAVAAGAVVLVSFAQGGKYAR